VIFPADSISAPVVLVRNTLLVSILVAALAGCGGNSDAGKTQSVPQAAQPVAKLFAQLGRFGTHSNCKDLVKLIHASDLIEPDGGANVKNCTAIRQFGNTLAGFKASRSAEFGTAALIDGDASGKPIALAAALDQDKSFKLLGALFLRQQIGTNPRPGVDFKAPAAAFVKALRAGDCRAAHAAISPISRLAYGNAKQFCSLFKQNYLNDPAALGARLRADRAADLTDLGGTRNVHFYGLATKPAGYRTIVVGTVAGGKPLVSDVVPVER